MAEIKEYIFIDSIWELYLVESEENFQKGDKIYDNDFKKDLIAIGS